MNRPIKNPELEASVLSVESDQGLNLQVPPKLSKPHPMVVELSLYLRSKDKYYSKTDKLFNQGYTIDLSVGKKNWERALLVLDTFIKAIEQRGHEIINKEGNTFALIFEEELKIRFWEKSRFIENSQKTHGYREMELTGELFIQYIKFGGYVERQWGDTPNTKLEDKLGRAIGSLEYIGKKEHEKRLEREEYWREQRRKEAIQKELNARKQNEFNNFKILLSQSLRFEKAQAIRAFVNHIEAHPHLNIEGTDNLQE